MILDEVVDLLSKANSIQQYWNVLKGQCGHVLSMASGAVWSCLEYGVRGSVVMS